MVKRWNVLITGASTGIGAGCCFELARRGWTVFAGVRSSEDGRALSAQCPGITPVPLDVTDAAAVDAAVAILARQVGEEGVSGLINSAGIAVNGPLEFLSIEEWRRQLEVNVLGLVAVTKSMIPMLRCGRGRIVNISSVSGRVAVPFLGPYAASKHAVEAISDALRIEVDPWGINVVLIEPGPVATPIWSKARAAAESQARTWPVAARELYPEYFAMAREQIDQAERRAVPVGTVVNAVCHALTARRPRSRYLVGPGSWLTGLRPYIPDRIWDALVKHSLRRLARAEM